MASVGRRRRYDVWLQSLQELPQTKKNIASNNTCTFYIRGERVTLSADHPIFKVSPRLKAALEQSRVGVWFKETTNFSVDLDAFNIILDFFECLNLSQEDPVAKSMVKRLERSLIENPQVIWAMHVLNIEYSQGLRLALFMMDHIGIAVRFEEEWNFYQKLAICAILVGKKRTKFSVTIKQENKHPDFKMRNGMFAPTEIIISPAPDHHDIIKEFIIELVDPELIRSGDNISKNQYFPSENIKKYIKSQVTNGLFRSYLQSYYDTFVTELLEMVDKEKDELYDYITFPASSSYSMFPQGLVKPESTLRF